LSKKRAIRNHYESRISPEREGFEIGDWADAESQRLRFAVLADNVPLDGRSLLDVGCGTGDLWDFLARRALSVDYTGVDIVDAVVEEARRRHPGVRFVCADVFSADPFDGAHFDVAFCSGTFNLDLGNNREFLPAALKRLFEVSTRYVVFNLLHHRARRRYEHCVYHDPEEATALVRPFGCDTRVVDDYLPNDFTVICKKPAQARSGHRRPPWVCGDR